MKRSTAYSLVNIGGSFYISGVNIMSENSSKCTLVIEDRKSVRMNGVKNVVGFDEGYVTIDTVLGRVSIEGSDLKIESLTKENGEIYVSGTVSAVSYFEPKEGAKIFKKMFK